jgi:signal transduction histidine kinase/DNA-binding response OmpR family regulator
VSRQLRLTAALVVLTLAPLALLTYFSVSLAADAVEREVEKRLVGAASTTADTVRAELGGLAELVDSYAARPDLQSAIASDDRARIAFHLRGLKEARPGIFTAFLADPTGRLIDIVPSTPAIVGDDFSFRDWYRGVTRGPAPYVSEAYMTQAAGRRFVVAVATIARSPDGRDLAILVGAYDLDHLDRLTDRIAEAEGATLRVVDQRGTVVAGPGPIRGLVSLQNDARVAAALSGRSGVGEFETADGERVSAYVPIEEVGWAVTTSLPANTAFAAVADLRTTVIGIAGALAVVLLAALAVLDRSFRLRARAEREALELAAINRAVLDSTTDAIAMMDLEGNVVLRNAELERLTAELGGGADDEGSPAERLARAASRTTDPNAFAEALGRLSEDAETRLHHEFELAEERRSFSLYSGPVRRSTDGMLGRIVTLRDVTKERAADRLKTEMLAIVSHELRTPLTGVLGFAELARDPGLDEATRDRYLTTIHGEARRLTALVNDFLDLQRIEAGAFTLTLESFDVRELIEAGTELFGARSDKHTLVLELPPEPLAVTADRERIAQVLENLLSNALKFSPRGGTVTLRAESLPGYVRISVEDEGLGIPADQQSGLFTKFFRVDTSDTRRIGGTGLGLALSRELVEAHAGEIGVESVEGSGSTFWFTLPGGLTHTARGSARVLVIEDDPTAASFLAEVLSADGFEIETVSSAEAGLQRAIEDPPSAICLDIVFPTGLQGWELLERLKSNPATTRIPVVVCTGRNNRERGAALGAADFLAKPLSAEQLREAVRRVVRPPANVLVVDDDPTVRRLIVQTLSAEGLELREASGGAEALELVQERRPDGIVLDLMMPDVDGLEVLDRLQSDPELRGIPVIVLTARRLTPEEKRSISSRVAALLGKAEYSAEELRRLVAHAVGGSPD